MTTTIQPELVTGWCYIHGKELRRYNIKAYEWYVFDCEVKNEEWELGEIPNQKYFKPILTKFLAKAFTETTFFAIAFFVPLKTKVTRKIYNLCDGLGENYLQKYDEIIMQIKSELSQST